MIGTPDDVDAIVALELGADDYLGRPFAARLLLARVKALLRRAEFDTVPETTDSAVLLSGDLTLDTVTREVTRGGAPLVMTPREFDLLAYLVGHRRTIVTRDQLIARVWGYRTERDTNSLGVHLSWLRTKIEPDPSRPTRIRTLRGRGYVFID